MAEKEAIDRAEAQQRLQEKLARAQQNRESIVEGRRGSLQDRAKKHAEAVHVHKATVVLQEVGPESSYFCE